MALNCISYISPAATSTPTSPDMSVCETLEEALDDLCMRFVNNMPASEYESFSRLLFTLEAAHWFYGDFHRENNPKLPGLSFRSFVDKIFAHSPFLRPHAAQVDALVADFKKYKQEVPTCGAAMLNPDMTKVLLVQGWGKGGKWGFPKGKIAKDETELQAAVREVHEETGFDFSTVLPKGSGDPYYIDYNIAGRRSRIFVVPNVPEDTVFVTQTRKEIAAIEWKLVESLPDPRPKKPNDSSACGNGRQGSGMSTKNTWLVSQYIPQLKSYIKRRREGGSGSLSNQSQETLTTSRKPARFPVRSAKQKSKVAAKQLPSVATVRTDIYDRDSETFGGSSLDAEELGNGSMTDVERDNFFRQYLEDADKRKGEMGIGDDFWPTPIMTSKDYPLLSKKANEKSKGTANSKGFQAKPSAKNSQTQAASLGLERTEISPPTEAHVLSPVQPFKFNRKAVLACLL